MWFNKLPDIFNKYESSQNELQYLDEGDYTLEREEFENQYYNFEAKFNELLHPVIKQPRSRHNSSRNVLSRNATNSLRSHISNAHIKSSSIAMPTFDGDTCN